MKLPSDLLQRRQKALLLAPNTKTAASRKRSVWYLNGITELPKDWKRVQYLLSKNWKANNPQRIGPCTRIQAARVQGTLCWMLLYGTKKEYHPVRLLCGSRTGFLH